MTTIDRVPTRLYEALWAGWSALLLGGVALGSLPFLNQPLAARPGLQAMFLGAMVCLNGLIAIFLALQSLTSAKARSLAWLSAGYAFTAVVATGQFFVFPGIMDARPVMDRTLGNVAMWVWFTWHAGFPVFVLMAMAAWSRRERGPRIGAAAPRFRNLLPVAVGVAAAVLLTILLFHYAHALPTLVEGDEYRGLLETWHAKGGMLALSVVGLAAVVWTTRLRELLSLWLALALFAFTLDVLLALAASARYTVGWYLGRVLSLASAAALMGALLIEHYRLHRDAELRAALHEEEAHRDALTGLFNRRFLMRELAEELGRARRYDHALSVLMMDIDYFKGINDRHGHQTGDECLRAVALALDERIHRRGDFVARYGGEEFAVVLPEVGLEGALELAEELRARIESLHAQHASPVAMTVSIGVAALESPSTFSAEELLAAADACLYRAKQAGRNRVVGPALVARPVLEPRLA